jgi:hypothetical protein
MSLILDGTNGLSDVDGSAATPAIRGTDTNTGIFFPAADTIAFSEGGAEAMRIDSSGNLGIGTTSPVAKVESKTGNVAGGSADFAQKAFAANSPFSTSNVIASMLSGWDGSSIHAVDVGYTYNGTGYNLIFSTNDNTSGSPIERARIDSSGNLRIGTTGGVGTTAGTIIEATGTIQISRGTTATANVMEIRNPNGLVGTIQTSGSNTAYNTSSDYRLKNTIISMTGALAKVAQLNPVTYKWNVDGSDGQGFIAHELAEVVPDCVTGEKDAVDAEGNPQYQGIDVSFLVATLTAAIQELNAKFEEYKAAHP